MEDIKENNRIKLLQIQIKLNQMYDNISDKKFAKVLENINQIINDDTI